MQIFGKLLSATLLAMTITLAVGGLGWFGLDATRNGLESVVRVRTPQIQAIDQMMENLNKIRVDEFALVNSRLEPERRQQILASLAQATSALEGVRRDFAALPMTPRQQELWATSEEALEKWQPKHRRMIELVADNRIVNVELLPGLLAGHLLDHRQWLDELRLAAAGGRVFAGDTNPLGCGLGRWLPTYQSHDPELQKLLDGLRDPHMKFHELGEKVAALLARGQGKAAQALLARDGRADLEELQTAVEATRSYVEARLTNFDVAINYVFGDVAHAYQSSISALKATAAEVSAQAVSDSEQATATGSRSQGIALAATAGGVLFGLLGGLLLARHMTHRLRLAAGMLRELEAGHLDVRLELTGVDEISAMSRAMDGFAEDLQERVLGVKTVSGALVAVSGDITAAAEQVTAAAHAQAGGVQSTRQAVQEIGASVAQVNEGVTVLAATSANGTSSVLEMAATSEELAGSAESLARLADEVGSSIAEVATSIQQVADNTLTLKESADATVSSVTQMDAALGEVEQAVRETVEVTNAVRGDVDSGQTSMATTIAGSHEIRQATQVTARAIESLSAKVQDIGKVLAMIDEVTDQTRLLALNAAIIAAQAGVHGQGFTVVAGEIRELSDRAAQSTREIASLIDSVQQETGLVVEAIARTERRVAEGEELANASGAALAKVVAGIQEIDRRMERIARATAEQAQGSRVIGGAVEQVTQMVDQTLFATREQGKASRTITAAVEELRNYAVQVKTSAREQSNGSRVLAAAMEEIDGMIRRIGRACEEQSRGSGQISCAVEEIHHFAEINLEATQTLQLAVATQNRQIGILDQQMGAFRVAALPPANAIATPEETNGANQSGTPTGSAVLAGRFPQRPEGPADPARPSLKNRHHPERDEEPRRQEVSTTVPPAANA